VQIDETLAKTSIKQKHTQQRGKGLGFRVPTKEGRKEGRKKQTEISLIALFRQDRKNLANLELGTHILLALPTTKAKKKDIVFRFIIEYDSSLRDFGPLGSNNNNNRSIYLFYMRIFES
jgi:hypothetical protein